jgi:hypothetical protein
MTQETGSATRRDFARNALQSLTAFALVEGLWSRRLLGEDVKPIVDAWFDELYTISRDVHEHRNRGQSTLRLADRNGAGFPRASNSDQSKWIVVRVFAIS